jgi:hypothetical protein
MGLQEVEDRGWYLVVLGRASTQFVRDVHGHIMAPTFSNVEGHDPDWIVIFALYQMPDQRLAVSGFRISLAPGAPEPAEVIHHKVLSWSASWGTIDGEVRIMKLLDQSLSLSLRLMIGSVTDNLSRPRRRVGLYRYPITGLGCLFQLKSGLTSAPRLPHALALRVLPNLSQAISQPLNIRTDLRFHGVL